MNIAFKTLMIASALSLGVSSIALADLAEGGVSQTYSGNSLSTTTDKPGRVAAITSSNTKDDDQLQGHGGQRR